MDRFDEYPWYQYRHWFGPNSLREDLHWFFFEKKWLRNWVWLSEVVSWWHLVLLVLAAALMLGGVVGIPGVATGILSRSVIFYAGVNVTYLLFYQWISRSWYWGPGYSPGRKLWPIIFKYRSVSEWWYFTNGGTTNQNFALKITFLNSLCLFCCPAWLVYQHLKYGLHGVYGYRKLSMLLVMYIMLLVWSAGGFTRWAAGW